jgi:hypothetical protein
MVVRIIKNLSAGANETTTIVAVGRARVLELITNPVGTSFGGNRMTKNEDSRKHHDYYYYPKPVRCIIMRERSRNDDVNTRPAKT